MLSRGRLSLVHLPSPASIWWRDQVLDMEGFYYACALNSVEGTEGVAVLQSFWYEVRRGWVMRTDSSFRHGCRHKVATLGYFFTEFNNRVRYAKACSLSRQTVEKSNFLLLDSD